MDLRFLDDDPCPFLSFALLSLSPRFLSHIVSILPIWIVDLTSTPFAGHSSSDHSLQSQSRSQFSVWHSKLVSLHSDTSAQQAKGLRPLDGCILFGLHSECVNRRAFRRKTWVEPWRNPAPTQTRSHAEAKKCQVVRPAKVEKDFLKFLARVSEEEEIFRNETET